MDIKELIKKQGKNLFRGKSRKGGKWYYGSLVYLKGEPYIHADDDERTLYRVDKESVGQFIGKFDKKGEPIFEGDVLKFESEDAIEYVSVFYGVEDCGFFGSSSCSSLPQDLYGVSDLFEVVGSVYEDPDYLGDFGFLPDKALAKIRDDLERAAY